MRETIPESWRAGAGARAGDAARRASWAASSRPRKRRASASIRRAAAGLRGARADPARPGQGGDPRAGSLSRPRAGAWPVLLGAARACGCRRRWSTSTRSWQATSASPRPRHGNLEHWARQGVLLLNNSLTVEEGRAGSHQKLGWEAITDAAVAAVAAQRGAVRLPALGQPCPEQGRAGAGAARRPHLVLTAPHPSPLSAHSGFFGCRHFSRANAFLEANGRGAIDWSLPPA